MHMDISVLVWLGEHRTDALTKIMSVLTHAGSEIAAIAVICLVYWCMSRRTGTRMLLTMLSGLMLNQLLKILFVAHRPWVRSSDVKPVESALDDATGYSFPSGHTANAAAAYGGLAHGKEAKPWVKALAWALVLLVAFSRMYLGVHTPQDVLVSLVLSIALIWLMDKLSAKLEEKPNLDIPVSLSILAAGALTLAVTLLRSYPAGDSAEDIARNTNDIFKLVGAVVGMTGGWLLERRLVRFEKPRTFLTGLIRFVLGIVLVVGILKGTKPLFVSLLGETWGGTVRYMVTCFAALYLWPLLFTALERITGKKKDEHA